MRRQEIDVRVHTAATPATVYALLRAGASWPTWSPVDSYESETPVDGDPDAAGAIRVFRTKRWSGTVVNREQVLELVPNERVSYTTLSGLPIRDYRADITLTPDTNGTAIHWHSTFYPKLPGTGGMLKRTLGTFIETTARGLAAHAARNTPTP
ncbi:MAG: SRPBCC family protein [Streptosporangiales bacterium]|nr:SRPBCC family protein [Streptosporangiales bacterium]